MQKPVLDKLDKDIIKSLARDGRASFREVGRVLNVSEGTIRTRITRLQDEHLVRVSLVGSPLALGVGASAIILIRVQPGHARKTAEILEKFPNVRFVGLSFGPADIILQSLHKDVEDLHRFVSEVIPREAPYVISTDTYNLADVMKSSWSWGDWFGYLEEDD